MKTVREYWKILLLIGVTPISLYLFLSLPCGFDAIGGDDSPKEWLGFWGGLYWSYY